VKTSSCRINKFEVLLACRLLLALLACLCAETAWPPRC
jgi:hypothetical protein